MAIGKRRDNGNNGRRRFRQACKCVISNDKLRRRLDLTRPVPITFLNCFCRRDHFLNIHNIFKSRFTWAQVRHKYFSPALFNPKNKHIFRYLERDQRPLIYNIFLLKIDNWIYRNRFCTVVVVPHSRCSQFRPSSATKCKLNSSNSLLK